MRKLVAAVTASAALAAPAAAGTGPAVRVVDESPFTVRGVNFKAQERVSVVAFVDGRHARTVTAGARGGFVVRFQAVHPDRCVAYVVRATGNRGSHAATKIMPQAMCPPPLAP